MRRRTFVAALGVGGLSGCLRSGDTFDGTPSQTGTATRTGGADTADSSTTEGTPTERSGPDTSGSRALSERWRVSGRTVTVADGVAYTADRDRLRAHDAADGTTRWTHRLDRAVVLGSPAVDGDAVYLAFRRGDGESVLRALDREDGRERWSTALGGTVRSTPLPAGESLLVNVADLNGEDGNDAIIGLRRDTGERRWVNAAGLVTNPGRRRLGTADGDGTAYVTAGTTSPTARVSKLDPATGNRHWDWTDETPASEPVYADGSVYLGTYADVTAIDAATGERRWRVETFDTNYAPPTVVDDTVYAGSRDTAVYAIEAGSGTRRWREQVGDGIDSVAATGESVIAGHAGAVSVLEADGTLATRERYDDGVDRVAHADGLLFVVAGSEVVAYRVSAA